MKTRITWRNLQRHKGKNESRIYGLAWGHIINGKWVPSGKIELDPRKHKGKKLMDSICHEVTHVEIPDMSEKAVRKLSRAIAKSMWEIGYRRVEL